MSAHKARRVIDQIRGRSYEETLMILELMPYRACFPILKVLYSAAANGNHNKDFKKDDLVITKAEVNEGSTVKKLKARARGRSYAIKRPSCHIRIELTDKSFYEKYNRGELENYYNLIVMKKKQKKKFMLNKAGG
ncbi:unnamed protein product [Linum tenue]|nr:unnamed protein product [Linum tenue]